MYVRVPSGLIVEVAGALSGLLIVTLEANVAETSVSMPPRRSSTMGSQIDTQVVAARCVLRMPFSLNQVPSACWRLNNNFTAFCTIGSDGEGFR